MKLTEYGPAHRWFAWHPVNTWDRGWKWLRVVHRRRVWKPSVSVDGRTVRYWLYAGGPA